MAAVHRARRWQLGVIVLLFWFNAGTDFFRAQKAAIHSFDDALARKWVFLWPPWAPVLAFVSHDTDEHLYFEYTRAILGESADLGYIAQQHHGDVAASLRDLEARMARAPATGWRLPYRDVPIEYPPVAVVYMLVPRVLSATLGGYRVAFGALAALTWLVGWWLARRVFPSVPSEVLWRRALFATLAAGSILVRRLDVLPAALAFAAFALVAGRRAFAAGVVVALGAAAKLYPLFFLPAWGALLLGMGRLGELARLAAGVAIGLGAVVAATRLLLGPAASELLQSVRYYGERPFQLESMVGGVALALGGRQAVSLSFGSFNVAAPRWLATVMTALLLAGLAAVALLVLVRARGLRRQTNPLDNNSAERALLAWSSVATLAWVLATSKVLSPQYFLWCAPLFAALPGGDGARLARRTTWLLALTQIIFPIGYELVNQATLPGIALLLGRNLLLLATCAFAVHRTWADRHASAEQ
jgi:hypothetical protein